MPAPLPRVERFEQSDEFSPPNIVRAYTEKHRGDWNKTRPVVEEKRDAWAFFIKTPGRVVRADVRPSAADDEADPDSDVVRDAQAAMVAKQIDAWRGKTDAEIYEARNRFKTQNRIPLGSPPSPPNVGPGGAVRESVSPEETTAEAAQRAMVNRQKAAYLRARDSARGDSNATTYQHEAGHGGYLLGSPMRWVADE